MPLVSSPPLVLHSRKKMPVTASSDTVMTDSRRGIRSALFAILPMLFVALLMLPEPFAFAGSSSTLEIEPPLEADSASVATSTSTRSSNDADDDDDDDDDDQVASKDVVIPDKAGGAHPATVAQPVAADNDKNLNSAQGDDADDDSDDDDDSDEEVAHAPVAKDTPALETRMDRETDSDGNDTIATSTITSALVGDYLVSLRRDVVAAHDPLGSARAEASFISIHKDLSETFALSGGVGSYWTLYYNDFVGSMVAHWHAGDWSISAGVARNLLAKSAESIRSNIRETDFGLSASYDLTKHLSSDFEFHHRV